MESRWENGCNRGKKSITKTKVKVKKLKEEEKEKEEKKTRKRIHDTERGLWRGKYWRKKTKELETVQHFFFLLKTIVEAKRRIRRGKRDGRRTGEIKKNKEEKEEEKKGKKRKVMMAMTLKIII